MHYFYYKFQSENHEFEYNSKGNSMIRRLLLVEIIT